MSLGSMNWADPLKNHDPPKCIQRFERITLPLPSRVRGEGHAVSPGMRAVAAALVASIGDRLSELKAFSVPPFALHAPVPQGNSTWDAYDGYFGVVRVDQAAPEVLIAACVKALNDIQETAAHGHDLSAEEERDLLESMKLVIEVANG